MKVKITYIGKRQNGDKVSQAFIDHNGKVVFFNGVKFVSIGALYQAEAKGKDGLSIARTPQELGQASVSEQTYEQWRIEERLALDFQKRKRAAAVSSKSDTIKRIANILRPLAKEFTSRQLQEVIELAVDDATKEIREEQNRRLNAQLSKALKRIQKRNTEGKKK